MAFETSQAGTSVGFKTYDDGPSTFKCVDFEGSCCEDCHNQNFVIMLFPWSVQSTKHVDKMPDLGMGLRAEVCCGKFHIVRELPREWWVRRYAAKQGWSAQDTEKLVQAESSELHLKVRGELASKYFVDRNPGTTRATPSSSRRTAYARKSSKDECPECGSDWDGTACDDCGHTD